MKLSKRKNANFKMHFMIFCFMNIVLLPFNLGTFANGSDIVSLGFLPPTRNLPSNPLNWVEASEKEIYKTVDMIHGNPTYLADDDPLTISVQSIADDLDERLRLLYPQRMNGVPKPKLRWMEKDEPNAFVSKALVCISVRARLGTQSPFEPKERLDSYDKILKFSANGKVGVFSNDQVDCLDRSNITIHLSDVINWLQRSLFLESCSVEIQDNFLQISDFCDLGSNQGLVTSTLALMATSNHITLMTGLLNFMEDPTDLIFTIYHELAHYYRSHGALRKSAMQYFYKIDPEAHLRARPTKDVTLEALGQRLQSLPQFRTQEINGQRFHSELFSYNLYALNTLVNPYCNDTSDACFKSCQKLDQFLNNKNLMALFKTFPQSQLTGQALELYFQWERLIIACYDKLEVSIHPLTKPSIPLQNVKKVYWNIDTSKIAEPMSLLDIFELMNARLRNRDRENRRLLHKALEQRVGFYTTELEADHLAADWLILSGFSANLAIKHWLKYIAYRRDSMQNSVFNFGADRCLALFQADPRWSENAIKVHVPVGSFSQSHQSPCFRLWNLDERFKQRTSTVGIDIFNVNKSDIYENF